MLWFIFLARILILGAVFNATYQELRQGELKSRRGDVITIIQSFSGDGSDGKKHKKHEDDSLMIKRAWWDPGSFDGIIDFS